MTSRTIMNQMAERRKLAANPAIDRRKSKDVARTHGDELTVAIIPPAPVGAIPAVSAGSPDSYSRTSRRAVSASLHPTSRTGVIAAIEERPYHHVTISKAIPPTTRAA